MLTSPEYPSKHAGSSHNIRPLSSNRQSWSPCRTDRPHSRKSHQSRQTQVSAWASRLSWWWCSLPSNYTARSGTRRCKTRSRCCKIQTRCSTGQTWADTRPNDSGCRRGRWCCKGWGLRRRCLLGSCLDRRNLRQHRSCWRLRLDDVNGLLDCWMLSIHTSHQHHSNPPTDFRCRYSKSSVEYRTSRLWTREPQFRVLCSLVRHAQGRRTPAGRLVDLRNETQ